MTNHDYSLEDLITNNSFLAFVFNTDAQAVDYWQKHIASHPDKSGLIEEAIDLVRTLAFKPTPVNDLVINQELAKLESSLFAGKVIPLYPAVAEKKPKRSQKWLSVAASILLLLAFTSLLWFLNQPSSEMVTLTTKSNSPTMLLLPDSSLVFLSGNSTIRYNKEWPVNTIRQVWLEGEAFFHVKPKQKEGGIKFQVHAGPAVVEVVGTRFNVLNRNNQTNVVLTAGKVNFKVTQKTGEKPIALVPGDMVSVNKDSLLPKLKRINVWQFPVLKEEKIQFENTSIRKIVLLLQEQFGLKVRLQDSAIADLKVSGSFPLNNEKVFLETLAVVLDLQMERKNNQEVFFSYK